MTGWKLAPDPFPPVSATETTTSTSKSWGSTNIFSTDPLTTGCIRALPVDKLNKGGFITS